MRILGVAQQLRAVTSGLGTYARGLVDGLVRRGHAVTLAVPEAQAEARAGVRLVPMAFTAGNVTPIAAPRMGREVRRVLAAEAPHHDVVHFLDAREAVLAGPVRAAERALSVGTVFVGTVHDAYALDWRAPGFPRNLYDDRAVRGLYYAWLRRIERVAYERTALLATNSRYVAAMIGRGYDVAPDRIHVVPIGLSPQAPVAAELLPGAPAVLFVGGNFQRKGLGTLLDAFVELHRRLPAARLHVVGGDPRLQRFRQRTIDAHVGAAVVFHGWQPHERVRGLMAGATVLAMAPVVEAFGLVYLEAMAAGVPVVAPAVGGSAELLQDGINALVVPRGDAGALANALGRVTTDAALRDRLRAGGAETVARSSMEATVAATEALYARASGRAS